MRVYVSNIPFIYSCEQLVRMFEQAGMKVPEANVRLAPARPQSPLSHHSGGFAFVLLPDRAAGEDFIERINGRKDPVCGRTLRAMPALPRYQS